MRAKTLFTGLIAMWCLCVAVPCAAQGVQTGTIRGIVRDQQDLAVPGVTVTATSPALQGARDTVTDMQGLFVIPALPPGEYEIKFELAGFGTITRTTMVPLGLTVEQSVAMR